MTNVYNCSECDYCYRNETLPDITHICVNYNSECFGQPVDWLGLEEEDMECVVIQGKYYDELVEDEMESGQNLCDTNQFNNKRFGD